ENSAASLQKKKYKVLLIEGQNNHKRYTDFNEVHRTLIKYIEEPGIFILDVATTPPEGENIDGFKPDFSKYDVVISNYNGALWPEDTRKAFEKYLKKGGGFVL